MKSWLLASALLASVGAGPLAAQGTDVAARVAALGRLQSATAPSFAPDGKSLAYLSNASGSPQIWIRRLDDAGSARALTNLPDPVGSVAWSPRGDWIAYTVAPGGGLNTQIWLVKPDGSGAKRLTPGGKDNNALFGWTRDGSRLMVNSNKDTPAAQDAALIDVATGTWQKVTTDKGLNTLADVRGDQAVVNRVIGRGDSNVVLVDLRTGRETLLTAHAGKAQSVGLELSADGRRILVGSNVARDRGAFGLVRIASDGRPSPIRYLAARADAVLDGATTSRDGRAGALMWNVNGRSELAWFNPATGRTRPGPKLPVDIASVGEFSADNRLLTIVGSSANRTTDIYTVDAATNAVTRVTESRHDGVDLDTLVRPELVEYRAPDGVRLSGWLYRPKGKSGPLPMVFIYHGGPEGQARPTMSPDAQALVASGIAVFAPNVRGSSGFGKAYMAMDDGAKRVAGVSDIKATTDALVARGLADPKRLGIMGGSYGGYMVMAGVTQYPDMFAAGANLFGIVNFESFFRETEPWMAAISTTEYGDPVTQAAMLKSLSPIHKLDRIRTPLFVLHGANDTNVPLVEAEQIVASLKARGVPVQYTLFPDEGHGWRKTVNRVRSTTEIAAFFARHLVTK